MYSKRFSNGNALVQSGWGGREEVFSHVKVSLEREIQAVQRDAQDHTPHHACHHAAQHTTQVHSIGGTKCLNEQRATDGHTQ